MKERQDILLTIAIPTYNRASLLAETLESVLPQVTGSMEILVCSNGSTDGTDALMERYCADHPFIRYVKSEVNKGIDANIHRCMLESRGRFVHLLSDDDILLAGAAENLLNKIERYPKADFFFYNICSFDSPFDLQTLQKPNFKPDADIVFTDKSKFIDHIRIFATLMSSFVAKRELWNSLRDRENYLGTDIYLSYVLLEHVAMSDQVVFIAQPSVAVRSQYTGSYRIFYAFSYQWKILLLKKAVGLGYDKRTMKKIFSRSIVTDLVPRVHAIRAGEIASRLDMTSLRHLIFPTFTYLNAWLFLYPALLLPVRLHKYVFNRFLFVLNKILNFTREKNEL